MQIYQKNKPLTLSGEKPVLINMKWQVDTQRLPSVTH